MPATEFVNLLNEAFPRRESFPDYCPIVLGIACNQNAFSDVVDIISRLNSRQDLISRLERQHPTKPVHNDEFDLNFWRVWTEAISFAWAVELAGFEAPRFADDDQGQPDIVLSDNGWLESKTIDPSPDEAVALRRMAAQGIASRFLISSKFHPNVMKKFKDGLSNAIVKLDRQDHGELVVFYSLELHAETDTRVAYEKIRNWATCAAAEFNVRIVVVIKTIWRSPLIDTLN